MAFISILKYCYLTSPLKHFQEYSVVVLELFFFLIRWSLWGWSHFVCPAWEILHLIFRRIYKLQCSSFLLHTLLKQHWSERCPTSDQTASQVENIPSSVTAHQQLFTAVANEEESWWEEQFQKLLLWPNNSCPAESEVERDPSCLCLPDSVQDIPDNERNELLMKAGRWGFY